MRILVYGFGPYRKWKTNITESIAQRLPDLPGLKKIVFKVDFDAAQFQDTIRTFKPELVIGMGQCARGRKIRIERKAINQMAKKRSEKPVAIKKNGIKSIPTSYKIQPGPWSRKSYYAGKYVCNYSMYIMLDELSSSGSKFAFIHVPAKFDLGRATAFVKKIISVAKQN